MSEKKYDDRRYISRGKFYVLHLDDGIMKEGVKQLNEIKLEHHLSIQMFVL